MLIGYRNFETNDNSRNNVIFGYLGWGQGWHNNHHHDPKSFDFGTGVSGKWWEFDPCKIFLPFLGKA
jgi:stearoyl-CoA desaturase (delta-9 desaturase)